MKVSVQDLKGQEKATIEVPFQVIENGKGTQAVHEAVIAFRAAQRSGTACTKTVGEVAGSNKKPWRQKGTGRARAGSVRSPLWEGGGVTHGPRPRDFTKKVSKNAKRLALRKALGERFKLGDVIVVESLDVSAPKTREIRDILNALGIAGSAVLVTEAANRNLVLACRNLQGIEVTTGDLLNPYQVLRPEKIVITSTALQNIGQRISAEKN